VVTAVNDTADHKSDSYLTLIFCTNVVVIGLYNFIMYAFLIDFLFKSSQSREKLGIPLSALSLTQKVCKADSVVSLTPPTTGQRYH
jgi:hypothetical protein